MDSMNTTAKDLIVSGRRPATAAPTDTGALVRQLLERAIARLEDPALPPAWVVHEVRKDLKRARALLRLCSERLPTGPAEKRCAQAARTLAHLRDADAMEETITRLRPRAESEELAALDRIGVLVARQRGSAAGSGGLPRPVAAKAARILREVLEALDAFAFARMDAAALDAGLARAKADTALAFRALEADPRTFRFHDLRKAVKREMYQRELSGRPQQRTERATLKKLADLLGELQDLDVLRAMLRDKEAWGGPVKRLVGRAMKELKGRAFRLGQGRCRERAS